MPQPSAAHKRHHTAIKIITGVIIVPVSIFVFLIAFSFVASVFEQSGRIERGDYTLPETPAAQPASVPTDPSYDSARKALVEGTNNPSFGAEAPTVTIVQFSDFACPFCQASFPGLREIGTKYSDTVRIIFRDWPGHEHSISLAMAAYCAGEQGKFWEMHDKLFQNQSDTFGSDKNQLAALAQQVGVYNPQFQACFDSEKYLPQIRQNFLDSERLDVIGTPTWFINGEKVDGSLTAGELERIIQPYVAN